MVNALLPSIRQAPALPRGLDQGRRSIQGRFQTIVSKVSIVITSGSREKLQFAAMMASVAAVSAYDVTVFLSMNALEYFLVDHSGLAPSEGEMGRLMVEKKAPEFMDLFEQAADLGDAKIYPCSMAMDVMDIKPDDLKPYLQEPLGLTKFMTMAEDGQCWSF